MARSTHLSLLQTDGVEAQVYFGFLHRPTVFGPMTLSITPSVMADHAKGEGHKNPKATKARSDGNGWERRGAYEYRVYGVHDERPPGWSQDNKTGWRDCGLPPGQAKKYGCRTYVSEGRRNYYYEDEKGRIIVRRPIIELHGSVDIQH